MGKFKVGDKVIAIKNGVDYDKSRSKKIEECYNYEKGWIGTVIDGVNLGGLGIKIKFENGRTIVGCNGCNFELLKEEQMKFKVGDLVEVTKKLGNGLGFKVGYKGRITGSMMDYYSKWGYEVDNKWYYYEHELKLIAEEKTMTKKEALKAMIDGHKVQSDLMKGNTYSYWNSYALSFEVKYPDGLVEDLHGLSKTSKWKLYKEIPKPKFTTGQTIVYSNGKLALVTEVHEDKTEGKHSYTLCNNPLYPKVTFVKAEDDLREIPVVKKEEC